MAQVMKYHSWPTSPKKDIPGYRSNSLGLEMPTLSSSVTFGWDNMEDKYSYFSSGSSADEVATLMQYCGTSLEMDYGPYGSSSSTYKIVNALINYFDYNKETTKYVSRSFYSADKWADLIYDELSKGRPVVYDGQSSRGGHTFLCDGYKYKGGTDYFHFNWGWNGDSDDYYVLTALNPPSQGIGGNDSNAGYNYGQGAIIGIQSSVATGEVIDITPNVINLQVNSMTPSSNTSICSLPVDITLNITNNSSDDYDGDIFVGRDINGRVSLLEGNKFYIPAGETKDVVITLYPQQAGTYNLVFFRPNSTGQYSTNGYIYTSFEVTESSLNDYVPVYGYYCDELIYSQFIIPASDLEDMNNATVNGVTFYAYTGSSISWGNAQFDVFLKEVDETTFANTTLKDWTTLDKVYSGSLSVSDKGQMAITFDTPYHYNGGNLLVGIKQTVSGSYATCYWVGFDVEGVSLGGYGDNIDQQGFLPYTTFD